MVNLYNECPTSVKLDMKGNSNKNRTIWDHWWLSSGYPFNEPVDPIKSKIPDYFSIITKPMDLMTEKHMLEDNMYFGEEKIFVV